MQVIFGGAFNPPTLGHLEVYHFLKKELGIKKFTYLPVGKAYNKTIKIKDLDRINMLKLMIKGLDNVFVSELELKDSVFQGTYNTLCKLKTSYEGETAFALGADHLSKLSTWKNAENLLSEFKIIVLNRNNIDLSTIIQNDTLLQKYEDNILSFSDFFQPTSSTLFRDTFDKSLLHESVYQYIIKHQLYKR